MSNKLISLKNLGKYDENIKQYVKDNKLKPHFVQSTEFTQDNPLVVEDIEPGIYYSKTKNQPLYVKSKDKISYLGKWQSGILIVYKKWDEVEPVNYLTTESLFMDIGVYYSENSSTPEPKRGYYFKDSQGYAEFTGTSIFADYNKTPVVASGNNWRVLQTYDSDAGWNKKLEIGDNTYQWTIVHKKYVEDNYAKIKYIDINTLNGYSYIFPGPGIYKFKNNNADFKYTPNSYSGGYYYGPIGGPVYVLKSVENAVDGELWMYYTDVNGSERGCIREGNNCKFIEIGKSGGGGGTTDTFTKFAVFDSLPDYKDNSFMYCIALVPKEDDNELYDKYMYIGNFTTEADKIWEKIGSSSGGGGGGTSFDGLEFVNLPVQYYINQSYGSPYLYPDVFSQEDLKKLDNLINIVQKNKSVILVDNLEDNNYYTGGKTYSFKLYRVDFSDISEQYQNINLTSLSSSSYLSISNSSSYTTLTNSGGNEYITINYRSTMNYETGKTEYHFDYLNYSNSGVNNSAYFLNTNYNYSTPYTPTYDGSPVCKRYLETILNSKIDNLNLINSYNYNLLPLNKKVTKYVDKAVCTLDKETYSYTFDYNNKDNSFTNIGNSTGTHYVKLLFDSSLTGKKAVLKYKQSVASNSTGYVTIKYNTTTVTSSTKGNIENTYTINSISSGAYLTFSFYKNRADDSFKFWIEYEDTYNTDDETYKNALNYYMLDITRKLYEDYKINNRLEQNVPISLVTPTYNDEEYDLSKPYYINNMQVKDINMSEPSVIEVIYTTNLDSNFKVAKCKVSMNIDTYELTKDVELSFISLSKDFEF